jgi:ABC-type transport system involved in cytochrome bd biosynthesis, ATPase and permease components
MTIAKGEWVGLAGENGAGKSTLLDLVAGLLSPTSGSIRIDRRPLDEWLATSPPLFGYVPQHPHIFDDTVGNNVTLGDGQPTVSIGLDPNTNALRLSGGEKQRVAVARALNDLPPILLFDEPTAALDAETEAYFARVLSRLKGRTTAIIVSHRPETLAWCDRVVHLGTDVSAPALRRQWPESDRETAPAQTSSPAP